MNYYEPKPSKRFNWSTLLLPFFATVVLSIIVAQCYDNKAKKRAEEAEKVSIQQTISVLETVEKNLNKEIVNHYEKIDSLIFVRDSVVTEHSTKTVIQLQQSIDSIFNRQSDLPIEARSY